MNSKINRTGEIDRGRVRRGWTDLPCLMCGEELEAAYVDLMNVHLIQCHQCEKQIDIAELKRRMDSWSGVLKWLETAPIIEE